MVKRRRISFIPVSAMSDIAFLLLIFLIVTSMSNNKTPVKIKIPHSITSEKIKSKMQYDIFVTSNGAYYFDNKIVSQDEIKTFINLMNSNTVVYIHADENMEYKNLDYLLNLLEIKGLNKCIFVTKKK